MDYQITVVGLMASASVGLLAMAGVLGAAAWSHNRALVARLAEAVAPHLEAPDFSDLDVRLEELLRQAGFGQNLLRDLGQLGVAARPGRLMLYGFLLAGASYLVAALRVDNRAGVGAFVLTLIGLYALVRWRAAQRWNDYRLQLPEALHVIASALAAGASLNQALKHAAREVVPPLQGELQRVVEDVEVGKTLEEALTDLKGRVPLAEFDMIIASLLIQQRSGGNLGELLNETAHLIKQNEELRQELQVLTSQAKASARLVGVLPVLLFLYLLFADRSYLEPLLTTGMGNAMLALAATFEVVGYWVVSRLSAYTEFEE